MILDQFGRPVHPPTMLVWPNWLLRDAWSILGAEKDHWREDIIVDQLRESLGVSRVGGGVGDTIRVRLPKRFTKDADV